MSTARIVLDATLSEEEFQTQIIEYAELNGWRCYHNRDSRRSNPGWPDLTLVRGKELIFLEVKSAKGTTTRDQDAWLAALKDVERVGAWAVWPADWEKVEGALRR